MSEYILLIFPSTLYVIGRNDDESVRLVNSGNTSFTWKNVAKFTSQHEQSENGVSVWWYAPCESDMRIVPAWSPWIEPLSSQKCLWRQRTTLTPNVSCFHCESTNDSVLPDRKGNVAPTWTQLRFFSDSKRFYLRQSVHTVDILVKSCT